MIGAAIGAITDSAWVIARIRLIILPEKLSLMSAVAVVITAPAPTACRNRPASSM